MQFALQTCLSLSFHLNQVTRILCLNGRKSPSRLFVSLNQNYDDLSTIGDSRNIFSTKDAGRGPGAHLDPCTSCPHESLALLLTYWPQFRQIPSRNSAQTDQRSGDRRQILPTKKRRYRNYDYRCSQEFSLTKRSNELL